MSSNVVLITLVVALIGFIINILVMLAILSRGRRLYHYLFALILLIAACWDFGIFLIMLRNNYPDEIVLYQNLITIPFIFLSAATFHFTATYTKKSLKKFIILFYVYSVISLISFFTGFHKPVIGVYEYGWGTVARYQSNFLGLSWIPIYYLSIFLSCRLLLQARKVESSPIARRHIQYILASFIVFAIAHSKVALVHGIDLAFLLPLGMLLIDSFGALIGIAIIKDQLFDITVLVKKGIVYSILAASVIFIFEFSQHLLAQFLGEIAGEYSTYIHLGVIAVVVAAFMPLKPRLEHRIEGIFTKKKIEF